MDTWSILFWTSTLFESVTLAGHRDFVSAGGVLLETLLSGFNYFIEGADVDGPKLSSHVSVDDAIQFS